MPNLYAPSSFDIPETVTDDELKQLLLPNNIFKKPEVKKQYSFSTDKEKANLRKLSTKSDHGNID
jgi:hypothetical protein